MGRLRALKRAITNCNTSHVETIRAIAVLICFWIGLSVPSNVVAEQQNIAAQYGTPQNAQINEQTKSLPLEPYLAYFEDPTSEIKFDQIIASQTNIFVLPDNPVATKNFGNTSSAVWLRLNIENTADVPVLIYILQNNPLIGLVELYSTESNSKLAETGFDIPLQQRPLKTNQSIFKLLFAAKESKHLYMRVTSYFPMSMPLKLYGEDEYFHYQIILRLIEGAIVGITLALLIYNLFLWYLDKQRLYLYLALYIISITGTNLSNTGYFIYLFPDCESCGIRLNYISGALVIASFIPQIAIYLELKARMPFWYKMLRLAAMFSLFVCIPAAVIGSKNLYLASLGPPILVMIAGALYPPIKLAIKGFRPAFIFIAATIAPLLSGVVWILYVLGAIPPLPFLLTYQPTATAIQLIILSFGLADRINELRSDTLDMEKEIYTLHEQGKIKSEFLAQMSHEIRTPINGVLGMIDIFRQDKLTAYQQFFADIVYRSGRRLLATINNVLDFSKLDAGKMAVEHVEFDLDDRICETLSLFLPIVEQSLLEIEYIRDHSVPFKLRSDPTKIGQIVFNLIDNAIKFSKYGRISIVVKVMDTGDAETGLLHLVIKDQGRGFDRHSELLAAKSIEQFIQATSTGDEYTGLGLSVVAQYIKLLGGTLALESYAGEGATFNICLPVGRVIGEEEYTLEPEFLEAKIYWLGEDGAMAARLNSLLKHWGMLLIYVVPNENLSLAFEYLSREFALVCFNESLKDEYRNQLLQLPENVAKLEFSLRSNSYFTNSYFEEVVNERSYRSLSYLSSGVEIAKTMSKILQSSNRREVIREVIPEEDIKLVKYKILVAEDNTVNQLIIKRILESAQCEFDILENGQRLLETYQQNWKSVGLILMDCEMPVMNGFVAAEKIRQFEQSSGLKPVKIIALTAHTEGEVLDKINLSGMDTYLAKPIDKETLYRILRELEAVFIN